MLGSDAWVIELFRVGARGDADGLSYGWGRGGGAILTQLLGWRSEGPGVCQGQATYSLGLSQS